MLNIFSLYCIKNYKFIFKFCLVGFGTFILNLGFVWIFFDLIGFGYKLSITCAYVLTTITHFFLNKFFTFKSVSEGIVLHGVKYILMLLMNYLITIGISAVIVGFFKQTPYISITFSTLFIASFSYLFMRHFVFIIIGKFS